MAAAVGGEPAGIGARCHDQAPCAPVALRIGSMSGEVVLELHAEASEPLAGVMAALEQPSGTPREFQQLLYEGRRLEPGRSAAEEGLPDGAWLVLVRTAPAETSLHGVQDAFRAKYLLQCSADVNEKDENGWTPLHYAADRGLASACQLLLQRQDFAGVNARDWAGRTALHLAASGGLAPVCKAILSRQDFTAVNAADTLGRTALHAAAAEGHEAICTAIVARRDFAALHAVEEEDDETALQCALGMGSRRLCVAVVAHCNAPALSSSRGAALRGTLLHWAISEALEDVCLGIVERRDFTAINAKDKDGQTALHSAAYRGLDDVCVAILEREDFAAVNEADAAGCTALRIAMDNDLDLTCEAILSRRDFGAINQRDKDGTLLHWAASKGHEHVCHAILTRSDFELVNDTDRLGCTALHYAAGRGLFDVCREMLRHPGFTSIRAKDKYGETAFMMAARMRTDYYRIGCDGGTGQNGQNFERICDIIQVTLGGIVD